MNVAVIMKESGKFVCNLSREAAEEMVNDDPEMYAIRESDTADVLLQAAAVIGNPILLAEIVEHSREPEVIPEKEEIAVVETPIEPSKPGIETPDNYVDWKHPVPKETPEKFVEILETPVKKRDKSPKRPKAPPVVQPVVFLDPPKRIWKKNCPPPRMYDVYQITSATFFRIRTKVSYNFGQMFGMNKITWCFPKQPTDKHTMHASFEVENKRMVKNTVDTLKGLGCVEVDHVPWTAEEHHKFSQQ
jgi:hypothetical protein